ncbi:phage tail tape measure protein [Corynebacterium riegelii]|uniref:phage tail tape measure protein n=1 Tax=Corynebacterium riegelii TaxID=156976 RepID=UPI002550CD6E|nr:phage tail tape measure protein [Corynebacterium riegelii]MDK7179966.1 phage tail tape measure protein [Corynebacterium riegelii]
MAGGKIDILVEPDTKGFVPKMESGLKGAIGAAGKLGAALGVAMGGAEAFKTVVQVGQEFESQLNTMRAVSQATGEQIEAITQRARELGNDTSLTATSASDAAAAMTELAKGGFSVEEAMAAAKGTLQLASAAQTDAATAATIQSQALQAFSLDASDAARVSDILAGAANASSAEIGDVANALQQSGAVAHQFGVSIDDTATAIAMFANAGITGSDAGTLLKTALLSLTNQGKPAQAAIEALGLSVYDAQGQFVGLPVLMGQLKDAAQKMTPEAYQAATATLFGSDAMRMAGVAAQQGKEGFDSLSEAVTRQGQAAEVAAAQTHGLPGAMERLENTVEDVALGTYEALASTMVAGVDMATAAIGKLGDYTESAINGLKTAAVVAGDLFAPMESSVKTAGNALEGLSGPIIGAAAAFAVLKKLDIPSHMAVARESAKGFGEMMQVHTQLAQKSGVELTRMGAALAVVESKHKSIALMADSARRASAPMRNLGANTKRWATEMEGLSRTATVARGNLLLLGGAAKGAAAGGFSLLRSGVSGVVNALGGPFNVAMMGGAALVGAFVQSANAASTIQDKLAQASRDAAAAQTELQMAVAGTTGALNEQGLAAAAKIADAEMTQMTAIGEQMNSAFNIIQAPDVSWWQQGFWNKEFNEYRTQVSETKQAYDALKSAAGELKIPMEDLGKTVAAGGPQLEQLMEHLDAGGEASQRAAEQLRQVKTALDEQVLAAQRVAPATAQIEAGMQVLADSSAAAEERLSALKQVLQAMGMLPASTQDAMINLAKTVDQVSESAAGAIIGGEGLGEALFDQSGKLEVTDKNAQSLHASLMSISDGFLQSVAAGNDAEQAYGLVEAGLANLAAAYELTDPQIESLRQQYALMPEIVETLVQLQGADSVETEIAIVWALLQDLPEGQSVELNVLSDDAQAQLEQLGIQLGETPDEHTTKIEAPTDEARKNVDTFIKDVETELGKKKEAKIEADASQAKKEIDDVGRRLRGLQDKEITITTRQRTVVSNAPGRASGGRAPGLATGGVATGYRLPTTGPGTESVDGFVGVDAAGSPLARLDAGEWVINRASSDKYDAELAAINRGTFPKLPGFANGGVVSSSAIKRELSFLDGTPYLLGGFSASGVDCSGAVSATVNVFRGEDPFTSRMSTVTEGNWLAARGAQPGKGGAGDITIGWWDRGGGANGHTAMQLADGTFVESGGNTGGGFTIGRTAGPLEGRGFTDWAHFPGADEMAESMGAFADSVSSYSSAGGANVSWGAADQTFDIIASLFGAKLYDQGGYLPHGAVAMNLSGKPEPVLTDGQWANLSAFTKAMREVAAELPGVVQGFKEASKNLDSTAAGLEAIAPKDGSRSIADAPTSAFDVVDDLTNSFAVAAGNFHANPTRFGLGVGGALLPEVFGGLRDAERGLADTRQAAKDGMEEIAERERELAEAREALAKLDAEDGGYDKQTKRKLEDAEKAVARARSAKNPSAERIADAEEKLRRAREDAAEKLDTQGKKRAKDRDKAADAVIKAEKNLNTTRYNTAQLAAQIGAGQITLAIEAAKAVYNLGKTVYETVRKIADWIIEKINGVEAARLETLTQSVEMMATLARGIDEARNQLTQLRMGVVNALLAEQQAQWQLGQARANYTQTQLRGIVDVANARAKLTSAELGSLRVIGTSVDDLWARTIAGLKTGKLTFGETVDAVTGSVREKLALEAETHKAQAEALKANADAALQLLDSSKAAAKAALSAKSATALLSAQAGRLKAMTSLGDGSLSTPQAMRMQRVTQLLAESADWTARDRKEIKIEESRRYERAAAQAKAEAMRILKEHFGGTPEYGKYVSEIEQVMARAGHYGFWNSTEDAQKVIEAALKDTSLGRAVQALETQQVEQQIADYEKALAETKVEVGNLAIDAQYAPSEAKARGDLATAEQQASYFTSMAEYYRTSDEGVKSALKELMDFNRSQSTTLSEQTTKQVNELQSIAKTAENIYNTLPPGGFNYDLPGAAPLPPSRVPHTWGKEIAAAMGNTALRNADITRVAQATLNQIDIPQISARYQTREDVEAARRARDEQLRAAVETELARTREQQLAAQMDRRFTAIERNMLPELTINLPGTEYMRTEDVAREMRDQISAVGHRVTVLEGKNGANYYKTRM